MRKYFSVCFILHLLILCWTVAPVFAGDKKGCAAVTAAQVQAVLKSINAAQAPILYMKDSPLAGLCEIALDTGGEPSVFYFDVDRNYLLFGNLMEIKTMTSRTAQSVREIQDKKRIDISKISLAGTLILGNAQAGKKVIILTDPDCPYCADLHRVIKNISAKRQDVAFYIRMFPLEMHKDAYWKSKSIICSNSLQLLQDCFDRKEIAKNDCQTQEIENTFKLAKSLGITGTPAIILPDGRLRIGALPEEELTKLLDEKI